MKDQIAWAIKTPEGEVDIDTIAQAKYELSEYYTKQGYRCVRVRIEEVVG